MNFSLWTLASRLLVQTIIIGITLGSKSGPPLLTNHQYVQSKVMTKKECRREIKNCETLGFLDEPICGSDGSTYSNECSLVLKQCELGLAISVRYKGPCKNQRKKGTKKLGVKTTYGSNTALSLKNKRNHSSDGDALLRDLRGKEGRHFQRNRQGLHSNNRNKRKNNCDTADKIKFNGNLIENFKIEYRRTNSSVDDKNVDSVLRWKFIDLDKNKDGFLDRSEYKELRRLARKAVRPKKCARTFVRTCDADRDLKLSTTEWTSCLTRTSAPLKGQETTVQARPAFSEESAEASDDIDANDCLSDQKSVLEDQRQKSQEKFYIPECTPDGRYHQVQCYSGYCWCVHQDTGKPIPGTSSKNNTPNCNPVPMPVRPMKGCPEGKKQLFMRDLMEFLQKKMKESGSSSDNTSDKWQASEEERIATWHFVMLDKNKNKVLERREWKTFRNMVSNIRQLKRCGKKLPRYCDVNNDRKISMTEWLNCLNAQKSNPDVHPIAEVSSTSKPRRIGPNPLDQFLNDDD